MNRVLVIAVGVVVVAAIALMSTFFTVQQTEQVLVLQFGEPKRTIKEPGLYAKIPLIQNVVSFDKRVLIYDGVAEEIIASDQKRLVVDAFLRYQIVDPLKFYQAVGNEFGARSRLAAMLNSSMRSVLGEVPLSAVLSAERSKLMRQTAELVNREAKEFGINVVDVRIKRADLPDANAQAIYGRMKAEREREAKEFRAQGAEQAQLIRANADRGKTVLLAEAHRKAQILRGEGDGERNRIFAEAYGKDPEFFAFYRSMQAYAEALGGGDTTMILNPDTEFFRYFNDLRGRLPGATNPK
ncbi:MAG: protease modulator HflC [Alphaproteobacteria bacterium]|nr:protease modulator HflC [Alphaproteobacteria bacterium]